jgi:hypothetical protein
MTMGLIATAGTVLMERVGDHHCRGVMTTNALLKTALSRMFWRACRLTHRSAPSSQESGLS